MSAPKITITKKRRFFDRYADIVNTARKTIVLPTHDSVVNFDWKLGDLKHDDREPVTVYQPKDLEEYGISINSRLLTINGIDTSILLEKQVEQLLRSRPLTLRFATRKKGADTGKNVFSSGNKGGGRGGRSGGGGGSAGAWGGQASVLDSWLAEGPKPTFSFDSNKQFLEASGGATSSAPPRAPAPPPAGGDPTTASSGMMLQRDMGHRNTSYAGVNETADAREARRRRFEGWAVQQDKEQKDVEDDEEEVVTVGPVVGKSEELEKSYLRLTDAAKASQVRALGTLEQALERLLDVEIRGEKSWNYVSDQLRAIRQDLQVQNIENAFTARVYICNARFALKNRDLGQFHQCAMQLKSLKPHLPVAEAEEIRLLRAVYNCFMGIESFPASCAGPLGDVFREKQRLENSDFVDPASPVYRMLQAFRLKNFSLLLRLQKKAQGSLGDLCACFDNQFRCLALIRLLGAFKVEKPNFEVLAWMLDIEGGGAALESWLVRVALIKDYSVVAKATDLAAKIRDSVAMNIRHQMK